jgi:thioredoxin-like negative regulator of GroEL
LQNSAQQLLANPETAGSADTLKTYSHDAAAQANLLAAHDYPAEAENAYNLASQLSPTNFEPVAGLSDLLYQTGRANQAIQILNDFAQKNPTQQPAVTLHRNTLTSK